MFKNREDAAFQLADALREKKLVKPVVLGIPRGGIVPAAILARELKADLDVLLTRKIRAPYQPEFAIGAISEDGEVFLYRPDIADASYIEQEKKHQMEEIRRRRALIEEIAKPIPLTGRSVIVTDDGIATGSTLLAGLHAIRAQKPHELIVAVPVAPPDTLERVRSHCDEVVCLHSPEPFIAIGLFYRDFKQVSDTEMLDILKSFKGGR